MSEAPGPTELATTQLLPYLAVGGNEEAWRAFEEGQAEPLPSVGNGAPP
jgi:hypothetical protein